METIALHDILLEPLRKYIIFKTNRFFEGTSAWVHASAQMFILILQLLMILQHWVSLEEGRLSP